MSQCKKYSDWLADASLGELASGREPELLAHASECEACREAYNHARKLNAFADKVDRGIESLVAGEPSPYFDSRLCARIAAEAITPRFNWRAWTPVAAGSVALVILLIAFFTRTPRTNAPPIAHNPSQPSVAARPANAAPAPIILATNHKPAMTASLHHHIAKRVRSDGEPEVLVPRGQLTAVMQFVDAIRSGRIDGPELVATEQQVNAPIEIKPIEIAPLSLQLVAPNDAPSAGPADPPHP